MNAFHGCISSRPQLTIMSHCIPIATPSTIKSWIFAWYFMARYVAIEQYIHLFKVQTSLNMFEIASRTDTVHYFARRAMTQVQNKDLVLAPTQASSPIPTASAPTPFQPCAHNLKLSFYPLRHSHHHPLSLSTTSTRQMASPALIERTAPDVVPAPKRAPARSRLPTALRVPILISLNMGINMLLWEFTANFLRPELGPVSKVPQEDDVTSFYSPAARVAMRWVTVWMTWYFNYDCKTRFPSFI